MTGTAAGILFGVGVILSIMIHEWGHFATARAFGMRADQFFVGFGPTLWSTKRGETEYGVKALPLGGFVRIKGMTEADERWRPGIEAVLCPADEEGNVTTPDVRAIDVMRRFEEVLEERGAPDDVAQRMARLVQTGLKDGMDHAAAETVLRRAIEAEAQPTGKIGDLHHRLLRGDENRFFLDRPAWQRAIVLAAGSALHFIQAIVLIFAVLWLVGLPAEGPAIDQVIPDTPAAEAGLQSGDRIIAIDGTETPTFTDARAIIIDNPGVPLALTVDRVGSTFETVVTPQVRLDEDGDPFVGEDGEPLGQIGYTPRADFQRRPAHIALQETFVGPVSVPNLAAQTFGSLGSVFGPDGVSKVFYAVIGQQERDIESGAVSLLGAGQVAARGAEQFGLFLVLGMLLASINIFIGVFNILPIPPLDGGHLAVLGIESAVNGVKKLSGGVTNFRVQPKYFNMVAIPVIVFFMLFTVGLVWLDATSPVITQ